MSNLESGSQPSRANLIEGARLAAELERRQVRKRCSKSLISFIEEFWPIVEPNREFVRGWALEAICEHLEAVSAGEINRLLMNVPPGFMKSLATDVFWPAWEWGPLGLPSNRYLAFSYSSDLTERDNQRFGAVVSSRKYQELWGRKVILPSHALGAQKVSNRQTGWKIASSVGGVGTGERADRVVIDDPHNVKMAESEAVRQETVRWFRESITSRMNDAMESAIIVIMQRVHEEDVSGVILDEMDGYCHLCIPMEYDGDWRGPTMIGWEDPRQEEGELAFPERFPPAAIVRDKQAMGPTAVASQFQQTPTPRGGNIIERAWWQVWPAPGYDGSKFPGCSLIVGSVDTRYGTKTNKKVNENNAFDAMTVFGVWEDSRERTNAVLMEAWRGRYHLCGVYPEEAKTEEERKPYWGLAEKISDTIRRRNIDILLIENKTRGGDLEVEVRRLLKHYPCQIILIEVEGNKVARLYANQALFADGRIFAPERAWAETVITEVSQFPKSKYADYTDTVSQALSWLRNSGALLLGTEADSENLARNTFRSKPRAQYDV